MSPPALLVHAAALAGAGLLLVSAGQPLFTEDSWWHLSMGAAYAAQGPWLDADPLLHTAAGAPAPAAWLSGLALHGIERSFGFQALRVSHVLLVAGILALAWSMLRRGSGSAVYASLGVLIFVCLSGYRLFQLRPHLLTILATLLLLRLLIVVGEPPPWRRVALATGLLGLWANLHAGFLLGPALLAAAVGGLLLAALLSPRDRDRCRRRARRLAAALGLGLLATLLNPSGARQHLLYFAAGGDTPDLAVVADEWARLDLFQLPLANLPPSLLAWVCVWALVLATPCALALHARRLRDAEAAATPAIDPALLAVGAACLVCLLLAVRFLWLGVVPLLLVGGSLRALGDLPGREHPALSWAAAIAALALAPGFFWLGDWPMISRGVHPASYRLPYTVGKLDVHAVWFLRDAELAGNLFNDYASGNFLGYWLAPRLRVFLNGSLNVPVDVMDARTAIERRSSPATGESLPELLDRYHVDVFFGAGVPAVSRPNRREISTTAHLECTPGWIPIFRNARSGIYLRADERNRPNLERVARYYRRVSVPFDPERGFDARAAIRLAPRWAETHGLVPLGHARLERIASSLEPGRSAAARGRLAAIHATLGLYETAIAMDRRRLAANPESVSAARRLVWSLLHRCDTDGSLEAANRLEAIARRDDALSGFLVSTARLYAEATDADAAALVAQLPLFTRAELPWLLAGFKPGEARLR